MKSLKKSKVVFILAIIFLILFFLSVIAFVWDAMTAKDVMIAWIIVGFMGISFLGSLICFILLIVLNWDRIKAYYTEIRNGK